MFSFFSAVFCCSDTFSIPGVSASSLSSISLNFDLSIEMPESSDSLKAALRLSELSGKAIDRLQFNQIDDSNDAETPRVVNVKEQQETAEKKENTLLNYA